MLEGQRRLKASCSQLVEPFSLQLVDLERCEPHRNWEN